MPVHQVAARFRQISMGTGSTARLRSLEGSAKMIALPAKNLTTPEPFFDGPGGAIDPIVVLCAARELERAGLDTQATQAAAIDLIRSRASGRD